LEQEKIEEEKDFGGEFLGELNIIILHFLYIYDVLQAEVLCDA